SGACLVLAAMTRIYAGVLVVFFVGYWIWRKPPWRLLAWAGLGAFAVAAPVGALYWLQTGDPLYPLSVQTEVFGHRIAREPFDPVYYAHNLWHPKSDAGLFGLLFMVTALIALFRWNRSRGLLFLW